MSGLDFKRHCMACGSTNLKFIECGIPKGAKYHCNFCKQDMFLIMGPCDCK